MITTLQVATRLLPGHKATIVDVTIVIGRLVHHHGALDGQRAHNVEHCSHRLHHRFRLAIDVHRSLRAQRGTIGVDLDARTGQFAQLSDLLATGANQSARMARVQQQADIGFVWPQHDGLSVATRLGASIEVGLEAVGAILARLWGGEEGNRITTNFQLQNPLTVSMNFNSSTRMARTDSSGATTVKTLERRKRRKQNQETIQKSVPKTGNIRD